MGSGPRGQAKIARCASKKKNSRTSDPEAASGRADGDLACPAPLSIAWCLAPIVAVLGA